MGLRYLLGGSGSGKTKACIEEMLSKESFDNNIIYIVPEQFTLEAERELITSFSQKSLLNTQVLSFKRLSYHLFSETGGIDKKLLDSNGKTMLLRKLLYEHSSELKFFTRSLDKQGFLENISNTITEFFQYGVTPEKIENYIAQNTTDENLRCKLEDLNIIYKTYLDYIRKEYISTDETLDILALKIPQSNMINSAEIWIDNFNAFTPQEYRVIEGLIKKAKSVTIALTIDSQRIDYDDINTFDFFYESKNTIKKLCALARANDVTIEKPLYLSKDMRHLNNAELQFLVHNYPLHTLNKYSANNANISVTGATNMYSEINFVANSIIKLVRDNGYKYSDIAIILGATDYEKPLANTLSKYEIPNFLDNKKSILSHPLTELIRSALDIITTNWSYSAVFRFLKTRLVPMSADDIDTLENYVLAYGIKGFRWQQEQWLYGFDNSKGFNSDDINYLKTVVTDILSPFTAEFKPNKVYTVKEISAKIFDLIYAIDVPATLNGWIANAKLADNTMLASEHSQIWDIIISIFDKLVEILGEHEVTIHEFSKILNSGFTTTEMGLIPPTQEHIIVGNIDRTKLPDIKALFVLGVNEGVLPAYKEDSGMFSDFEKDIWDESGIEISATTKRKINQDVYSIYATFAKATEKLYITYSTASLSGDEKRQSTIIYKLKSLYPRLTTHPFENSASDVLNIAGKEPTFVNLINALSNYAETGELSDIYKDIYTFFKNDAQYSKKLELIEEGLFLDNPVDYLSNETAQKLYGNSLYTSVSKLELFSKCPFSFFMEYGIKAHEREEYQLTPLYMGNLFHKILEQFSLSLKQESKNWRELSRDDINAYVNNAVDTITPTLGSDILLSTSRFKYMLERVKRISQKSIYALSEHIKAGYFEPLGYEIGFGVNESLPPIVFELENGKKIILRGKIDRVDVYYDEENNNHYVKILDYKSYTTSYDLANVYYGLQLQLIIYLDAFVQKTDLSNAIPAGIFYFTVDDPIVSDATGDIEKINAEIFSNFKIRGLLLANNKVLNAFEKEKNLDVYNDLKKLATMKQPLLADITQMDSLREFANKKVCELGNEMLSGSIKIEPYKKGSETGCDYCKYSAICRLETLNKQNKYRVLTSLKKDDIWSKFKD